MRPTEVRSGSAPEAGSAHNCPVCRRRTAIPPSHALPEPALRIATFLAQQHANSSLNASDMVTGTGLKRRTIEVLCQQHWGLTPRQLLTRIRLFHAQAALLATVPGAGTVEGIARSVGYTHMGRFSAAYLARYGEPPTETLRRGPVPVLPPGVPAPHPATERGSQ